MITILAGGTGSVKLIRGIHKQVKDINVISNVADNFWHHGLYICPDIDTTIYGLSNKLDLKKGWGISRDSFNFLNYMKEIKEETWFGLGDKDLSTHIIRTKMLKEGKNLEEITKFFTKKYKVPVDIIPASKVHYETHVITRNNRELHLQEYWIKHRGKVPITNIIYNNIEKTELSQDLKRVLEKSKIIIFAPGNPITSIGPIINIKGMKNLLKKLKSKVIAISPLVSNKAFSGPCLTYMKAIGVEPNMRGLIGFYSDITNGMIFDMEDKNNIERITDNKIRMNFYYTDIFMNTLKKETKLGQFIVSNFYN